MGFFTRLNEHWLGIWRRPFSFSCLVSMGSIEARALHARLTDLRKRLESSVHGLPGLHSLRLAVVPPEQGGELGTRLLLNAVHDQPLGDFLPRLVQEAGVVLAEAYAGASGYSGEVELLFELLSKGRIREQTVYLGAINKTVAEILGEDRLRRELGLFADRQLEAGHWDANTSPQTIHRQCRDHLFSQLTGRGIPCRGTWTLPLWPRLLRFWSLTATFLFPFIGVLATDTVHAIRGMANKPLRAVAWVAYALWWVYGAIPSALAMLGIRLIELLEKDRMAPHADDEKVLRLEAAEDLRRKNEVTLWFPVRPTWIRRLLLRTILFGSSRGCRHFWTDGKLAEIETIHYARLLQIDGGRTMVFMSDYDGSLNRYLDDFLGIGSRAVIPISSSLDGCPKTKWLYGQADPESFGGRWKGMIRTHQLETAFWYNAYPLLTVAQIIENARFRDELFSERLSQERARRWVRRL